jgi:hypothetical protein
MEMYILLLITFVGLPEDLFVLMEMYILLLITFLGLPEDLFVLLKLSSFTAYRFIFTLYNLEEHEYRVQGK